MHNERMDDLFLFACIVESKSFSLAAEQLNVSRSVVSKRLGQLEQRLGVQLMQRTTRKLTLTAAGKILYQHCQELQQTLARTEQAVAAMRTRPQGDLQINVPVTFGQLYLSELLVGFLRQYPDVNIKVSMDDRRVDLLQGGYDLAIRIAELQDSSLRARRIGSTRLLLLAAPDYLAQHGTPQQASDLSQHNCLTYSLLGSGENRWRFSHQGQTIQVAVKGNLSADNGMPLIKAAREGLGIVYLPDFMLQPNETLVHILPDYCQQQMGIYAIYPDGKIQSVNTRAFIDYLAQAFQTPIVKNTPAR